MQNPSAPRARRSQRDYRLPVKLAVVGEVGRGELRYKQAQRRYGIQGRSTVLTWCRRYATHFVTFQASGPASPIASPAMDQSPEQRIKQLETQLREQQHLYEKQLKDGADLNLLLRTMRQVVEEDHGIPLPKKSLSGGCLPPGDRKKPGRAAQLPALRREPARPLPAPPAPGERGLARRAGPGAGAGRAHPVAAAGHAQAAPENRPAVASAGRGLRARCLVHPAAPTRALDCPQAQLHENDRFPSPLPLPPQRGQGRAQAHGPQSAVG